MKRIIVSDSCAEVTEEMLAKSEIKFAPFFIDVDDVSLVADDTLDIDNLIELMKNSKNPVRTAAPTPESFYEPAKGYDEVFFVTISSRLSTSYNSAHIAKTMLEEENPNIKIHIFDSKSAVSGETKVIDWIQEEFETEKTFEEIVENVEAKLKGMQTLFVLESLDNLIKNGRVSKFSGFIASALSIYPVSTAEDGEIVVQHKIRGMKAAINKMVDMIGELVETVTDRTLFITYVRNKERAELIKELVEEKYDFKDIKIFSSTALSSTYANDGGIVMAF